MVLNSQIATVFLFSVEIVTINYTYIVTCNIPDVSRKSIQCTLYTNMISRERHPISDLILDFPFRGQYSLVGKTTRRNFINTVIKMKAQGEDRASKSKRERPRFDEFVNVYGTLSELSCSGKPARLLPRSWSWNTYKHVSLYCQ